MKLQDITPLLSYTFSSEKELLDTIKEIGHNFTLNRREIGKYTQDEKYVSAYACFYLLTNIPKLKAALEKINLSKNELSSYEIIDIGMGPGTFSMALFDLDPDLDVVGIDSSFPMIKQAKKFIHYFYPTGQFKALHISELAQIKTKSKPRLGIFGHSANEMDDERVIDYCHQLELDRVIFIEPGTKDFFEKMIRLRTRLLENFNILYPCLSNLNCPIAKDDWCHQYLKVSHEVDVERISQLLHKDRRNLPIIIHDYAKKNNVQKEQAVRLIRVQPRTKFSFEWVGCCSFEKKNKILEMQIMTRRYKKSKIKELQKTLAGDLVFFKAEQNLPDGKIRGELIEF
ncbi:MAG: small ribosomal subunit Rsm22 family protein [Bacteriovoracaceae bacterium]|jgi:ribosomal protein RSM22 (predicted rRNA methylase)|nr:small ribosomal subunit Rsm22 family protein [Bacteriovoracaceae bacterium]